MCVCVCVVSGTIAMRMSSLDDLYQSMCAKWVESYGEDSGKICVLTPLIKLIKCPPTGRCAGVH